MKEPIEKEISKALKDSLSSIQKKDKKYSCYTCEDTGWILDKATNYARHCDCFKTTIFRKRLEKSGVSEKFISKTLEDFLVNNRMQEEGKTKAVEYVKEFNDGKNAINKSIAFLGQIGSGKTHLCIGIANRLMKQNIGVCYMGYREVLTKLKQNRIDEIIYEFEINKYKKAEVLLIDDLYKGALVKNKSGEEEINKSDASIMFEIINYRYLKQSPMIISSEYEFTRLIEIEESLNSRIFEMCKGNIVEFKGSRNNYRIFGESDLNKS